MVGVSVGADDDVDVRRRDGNLCREWSPRSPPIDKDGLPIGSLQQERVALSNG